MEELKAYIQETLPELKELIIELCGIPAPSHHEEKRAEFCRDWLLRNGASPEQVRIDEALNVVCEVPGETEEVIVFMAHTDTVFPDREPMPYHEENGRMLCPGIGDDTANLAVLLMLARYVLTRGLHSRYTVVFAANSCEEGLGNLKGSFQLMKDYGSRTVEVVSFDGYYSGVANDAVGSTRYEVTVRTEGGHSFGNFGNRNAIHQLSRIINDLYGIEVPTRARTTYNVGVIHGGTSVNTIAQDASMLYEYRSEDLGCQEEMRRKFEAIVEQYRADGLEVEVRVLGNRPCAGEIDRERQQALTEEVTALISRHSGEEPVVSASSTDCNVPLSMGINAICFGVCLGGGAHTREEWIDEASLPVGYAMAGEFLLNRF